MGINMHVYTVFGVRLDWDADFYEAYEEIEEALMDEFGYGKPHPADRQIEAIMDNMCGEYMILGHIIYDSGDFRYCDDMNNYQEIEIDDLLVWPKYMSKFVKLYPQHLHLLENVTPKLINLIHYT